MPLTIKGDKDFTSELSVKNKALRINYNENIYGTFAEIGAGQETVRNFFRVYIFSSVPLAKFPMTTISSPLWDWLFLSIFSL